VTELEVGTTGGTPAAFEDVWARAVAGLPDGTLSPQHRAWVLLTRPLGLVEDTALIAAPNEFAKDVLDSRLRPVIAQALSAAYGRDISVADNQLTARTDEEALLYRDMQKDMVQQLLRRLASIKTVS